MRYKKIITSIALLICLFSSVCIASSNASVFPNQKQEHSQLIAFDMEKFLQETERKNQERYRKAREAKQIEEQKRAILAEQHRQEQQRLRLFCGALTAIALALLIAKRKAVLNLAKTIYKTITPLQTSQIFLIAFLLVIATQPHWRISGGFYTLLRILATVISIWSATKTNNNILRLVFAFIAILFNPIILVELDRNEWKTIDFTVATFYLGIVLHSLFIKTKQK